MKIKKYQNPYGKLLKNEEAESLPLHANISELKAEAKLSFIPFLKTLPRRASLKITQAYNSITGSNKGNLGHKLKVDGPGTDIVSLDNNVIRVTPDTEQRGTLFNEFVEASGNPTIRRASEYKGLPEDAVIGDRNMPVKNFNLFAGIENGHWKMDLLLNFNDTTTIIPVRNIKSGIDPIQEIIYNNNPDKSYEKELNKLNKEYHNILFSNPRRKPFYSTFAPSLGDDPRIVPNDKSKLTEEQLDNIGKRLHIHQKALDYADTRRHITHPLTDSLQYYFDLSSLPEYVNNPDSYFEMIKLYSNRESERVDKILSQHHYTNDNPATLNDYTKPLTEEELLFYNSTKSSAPRRSQYYYGDILGFNPKSVEIYNNLHSILSNAFTHAGLENSFNEDFLENYDKNLYDYKKRVLNANLTLVPKINLLYSKKDDYLQVVTDKNDTIPMSSYAASIKDKKMVLGNPNGGMFVADFNNLSQDQLDNILNPYLKENPSYLFMPDMGSYSLYGLQNGIDPKLQDRAFNVFRNYDNSKKPTYNDYWLLFTENESKAPYNPKMHYLVGVLKNGGEINYINLFK